MFRWLDNENELLRHRHTVPRTSSRRFCKGSWPLDEHPEREPVPRPLCRSAATASFRSAAGFLPFATSPTIAAAASRALDSESAEHAPKGKPRAVAIHMAAKALNSPLTV